MGVGGQQVFQMDHGVPQVTNRVQLRHAGFGFGEDEDLGGVAGGRDELVAVIVGRDTHSLGPSGIGGEPTGWIARLLGVEWAKGQARKCENTGGEDGDWAELKKRHAWM